MNILYNIDGESLKLNYFDFLNKPEKARFSRAGVAGFLISLLFHIVFVDWLLHSKVTVKFYPDPLRVRDVRIVSPDKVSAPARIEKFSPAGSAGSRRPQGQGSGSGDAGGESSRTEREVREAGLLGTVPAQPVYGGPPPIQFNLSSPPSPGKEGGFKLNLSQKSRRDEQANPGAFGQSPRDTLFLETLYPAISKRRGKAASSSGAAAGQKAAVFLESRGFDIKPWAEKAINKILVNWTIPSLKNIPAGCQVKVAVTIDKTGELTSIQLTASSTFDFLDQAALASLRISSPLPELPDGFPAQNIEALFVFTYND